MSNKRKKRGWVMDGTRVYKVTHHSRKKKVFKTKLAALRHLKRRR